jgi:molybdopterin converting factor small subunit
VSIVIHLPAILSRHAAGARTISAGGDTVGAVLASVEAEHPALGRRIREATETANPFVTLYLNDEDVRFHGGHAAAVRPGDELSIVSAIAGG